MLYDLIIIGAGAAGLFAGASLHSPIKGLILNKGKIPGQKILMSGGGKCNLTHGGSIKRFPDAYGENGKRIRTILYQFNNDAVRGFFESRGIQLWERHDGKVFPTSFCAEDIRCTLVDACLENGFVFKNESPVTVIFQDENDLLLTVCCGDVSYKAKKLLIATGGCSYPGTGSDGSFFPILHDMGFFIVPPKPALSPVYVEAYPYKNLSGISFSDVSVSIYSNHKLAEARGDVLLAHSFFSGPAILDISEYAQKGCEIRINYCPQKDAATLTEELSLLIKGNEKAFIAVLYSCLNSDSSASSAAIPKRFLENICRRAGVDSKEKASHIAVKQVKGVVRLLLADSYKVSHLGDYRLAMVTAGGVSLDEINPKSLESKKYPGIYFAGEVLDVAGKTGGYNLQFAFSSGHLAASEIEKKSADHFL